LNRFNPPSTKEGLEETEELGKTVIKRGEGPEWKERGGMEE
jgi:hypothetical protein